MPFEIVQCERTFRDAVRCRTFISHNIYVLLSCSVIRYRTEISPPDLPSWSPIDDIDRVFSEPFHGERWLFLPRTWLCQVFRLRLWSIVTHDTNQWSDAVVHLFKLHLLHDVIWFQSVVCLQTQISKGNSGSIMHRHQQSSKTGMCISDLKKV